MLVTDNVTYVTPLGLAFTLLMAVLFVVLPRRYALVPVIALTCYMTMGERLVILGLNFTMIRVLALFGWGRVLLRGEARRVKLSSTDKALIAYTISTTVAYTLLWQSGDAFINRCGQAYNVAGMYFLFRILIRDMNDAVRTLKTLAVLIVPLAVAMCLEKMTARNIFAAFGGVNAVTVVRDGALRCQGPFAHPILAGTFGATLSAMFIALYGRKDCSKWIALLGIASATVITVTSASSGPVMAYLFGLIALVAWKVRQYTRQIRWGIVFTLILLHLVMKAPVWFLVARADVFNGSTGYHRAFLIDRAIANFSDWWLVGTKSTEHWAGKDAHLFDITNQYIYEGANGGLISMWLFILVIVRCFRSVGLAAKSKISQTRADRFMFWAMGASLLAHCATYISVEYFDQNFVNYYLLLAMITSASMSVLSTRQVSTEVEPSRVNEMSLNYSC